MSWFSKITHTEGLTPDWLKKAGDVVAPFVIQSIPGAGYLDAALNLTNQGSRPGNPPTAIAQQTLGNVKDGIDNATRAAAVQSQASQVTTALMTPIGMILIAGVVVAVIVARKK